MLGAEGIAQLARFVDPVAFCSMTGIAKCAVNLRYIVLIFSQNGD